jgi:predicted TIM-barrel enzyme
MVNPYDTDSLVQAMRQALTDNKLRDDIIRKGLGQAKKFSWEETARRTQEVYDVARKIKPDIILLTHGAALSDPQSGQRILELTDGHGVQTGSATERIPLEEAVLSVGRAFKHLRRR